MKKSRPQKESADARLAKTKKSKRRVPTTVVARNLTTGESFTFPGDAGAVQFELGKQTIYVEVVEFLDDSPPMLRLHVGMWKNMKIVPVNPGEVLVGPFNHSQREG